MRVDPPRLRSEKVAQLSPVPHYLGSFLLELLDGSLVDAPAFVDEVTCGGGLPRIHMADHHDVDVEFFLSHVG